MERNYSKIYGAIVETEDDFVGIVAYSIYKKNKIQYIENFKRDNGRRPTDTDLSGFHNSCYPAVKQYKADAAQKVQKYVTTLIEDKVIQINDEYISSLEELVENSVSKEEVAEIIEETVKKHKHSFWVGIAEHLVASAIIMVFTIIIFAYYASRKIEPLEDAVKKYDNFIKAAQDSSKAKHP